MRIEKIHSHLNGHEWILVHQPEVWSEIQQVIRNVDAAKCRTKISKEKTKKGEVLYSPIELNARFKSELETRDWKQEITRYWVTDDWNLIRETVPLSPDEQKQRIEAERHRAIKSYNQTDFVKNRVAIEIQFGKYSFIPYDLFVKHMAFYVGDKIDVGVEILPMKVMQEQMSSGIGYYEGTLYDIARQGRGVPAVPLVLIGIVP
ncbi:MAG: BglII/BstYI family type II restriction endonuclease [Terriglobales bacterium]